MSPEAISTRDLDEVARPFRRLDPSGRRSALWAWIDQAQGDPRILWSSCPRGDWLAWWLAALRASPFLLVRACCECLRMAEAGLPLALDAPRRFLDAASAWSDGRGSLESCQQAAQECSALVNDEELLPHVRAVAQAVVWLARYISPEVPEDGPLSTRDASSEVYLALWHSAAAITSEVNPDEPAGSSWWGRCLEAALGRFAEVIRGCISFDESGLA